nr:hypothetical protein [Tanacetum cinerariifolium]
NFLAGLPRSKRALQSRVQRRNILSYLGAVLNCNIGFATGATPPKKVRKFKNSATPQLTTVPVSPKEPAKKSKRVKRPAKKSSKAPA